MSEQYETYTFFKNENNELMLSIASPNSEVEAPRFLFDGESSAILYRSGNSSLKILNIHEELKDSLSKTSRLLVTEVTTSKVFARSYEAPVVIVDKLPH